MAAYAVAGVERYALRRREVCSEAREDALPLLRPTRERPAARV